MTYDPDDILNQIYHKYFPRNCKIDSLRYLDLITLKHKLEVHGFKISIIRKRAYEKFYENVDSIINLI